MAEKRRERFRKFNLITGEDTYAAASSQNPVTSRKVKSFIPSMAGDLPRERPNPTYLPTVLDGGAKVGWLHQFDKKDSNGDFTAHFFAATSTKLFTQSGGAWVEVTEVGTLTGYPQAVNINNLMHLSDGTVSWLFDGTNWVADGIAIQPSAPEVSMGAHPPDQALGTNWTNPDNIKLDNNTYATYNNTTQDNLRATEFGIFPPVGITILGIEVIVRGHGTSATALERQIDVSLTKDGINPVGAPKTGEQLDQDFDNELILGSPTDLWGTTWSSSDIGDDLFGALIKDTNAVAAELNIDSVEVRVHYGTGDLSITTNRFYWTTAADDGSAAPERAHESSSSEKSGGTGPLTNRKIVVFQQQGTVTSTLANDQLPGKGTDFRAEHVGMTVNVRNGAVVRTVIAVDVGNQIITLDSFAPSTNTDAHFTILPPRATHWYLYASEAENSNIGLRLAVILAATFSYDDESPFIADAGSLFTTIERPIRNDPPVASTILTVHKSRIFRRRKLFPNFFNFSAAEEISGANGSPEESVPGIDPITKSDIVNETTFPDESDTIRNMTKHGDVLYIGTEDEMMPLYGESIDDFALSEVTAFSVGVAGRYASDSTPYGLAFMEFDREVLLYPTQGAPPPGGDFSEALIEIGRPQEKEFAKIEPTDLDNVRLLWWPRREWLFVSYQKNDATYRTIVYDFEFRGWFELGVGYVSLAIFEITPGNRIVVAGGTDGLVYVVDDPDKSQSVVGLNFPEAAFRPALIDFGQPEQARIFRYLEYEVNNLDAEIVVTYWLDPIDVENLDEGTELIMSEVLGSANKFRGFTRFGGYCERLLVEIKATAGTEDVTLRSINVVADPASNLAR